MKTLTALIVSFVLVIGLASSTHAYGYDACNCYAQARPIGYLNDYRDYGYRDTPRYNQSSYFVNDYSYNQFDDYGYDDYGYGGYDDYGYDGYDDYGYNDFGYDSFDSYGYDDYGYNDFGYGYDTYYPNQVYYPGF